VCALLLAGGVCRVPGLLHLNLLRLLTDIYLLVKISLWAFGRCNVPLHTLS
jgi:hypothetical protein